MATSSLLVNQLERNHFCLIGVDFNGDSGIKIREFGLNQC